jgi:Cu+-exporting ATPase
MVTKKSKDFLYGGTTVVEGSALMRVTALGDDSVLGKILSTVQEAQTSKPPIQEFADKVARYFVPVVACISVVTLLGWIIVAVVGAVPNSWYEKEGSPYLLAFYFALSVWVSACPCAFGLATPTAVLVATGIAAKYGILVRRGAALQFAAEVNTVAFDKTGTLTKGCTEVSDFQFIDAKDGSVVKLPYYSASEDGTVKEDFKIGHVVRTLDEYDDLLYILRLLLAAEVRSSHPLAKGLTAYCKQAISSLSSVAMDKTEGDSMRILPSENALIFDVVPGQGVHMHSNVDNSGDFSEPHLSVLVGSPKLLEGHGIPVPNVITQIANGYRVGGKVALFLSVNGVLRAVMGVSDAVRPEALHVIASLKKRGIRCFMVTGDEPTTARAIGASVGIPSACILASAKPEDKEQFIAALQTSSSSRIAFVGDGTNDSPALARANVGFTMASGSDIALEAGDMVLCRNDLRDLLTALKLSRQTLRKIRVNYVWAFAYNLLLIPLASGVLYPALHFALSPMFAGAAMALSSVSVVVSSLLLFLFTPSTVGGVEMKNARIDSAEEINSSGAVELSTLNTGGEHAEKLVQCNCPVSVVEMVDNSPSSFLSSLGMISEHSAFQEVVDGPTAVEILASYKEEKLKQNFVEYSKHPRESETKNILMRSHSLRNRRMARDTKDAIVGQGCGCGKGNCKCGEGCKCGGSK